MAHVRWAVFEKDAPRSRGIAGVKYIPASERLCVVQLAGEALPASLLLPLLDAALGEGWAEEAERLHLSRANPWRAEVRTGMSGARDYRLRVLKNSAFGFAPVQACLHVSMEAKLNKGLALWLGDVPPLLAKLLEDFPPPPGELYAVQAYNPRPLVESDFSPPGASSGLREQLEALKALEALGDNGGGNDA